MPNAIELAAGAEDTGEVLDMNRPQVEATLVKRGEVCAELSSGQSLVIRIPTMGELRGIGLVGLLQGNPDIQAEFLERTSELGRREFFDLYLDDQVAVIGAISGMLGITTDTDIEIGSDEQELEVAGRSITLKRPKVRDLRGTDLVSLGSLMPESLAIVIPRISQLTKKEFHALSLSDGLKLGVVVAGFLAMNAYRMEASLSL